MKSKILFLIAIFSICVLLFPEINAQPFLFNIEFSDNSSLGFPPLRLDKVNLSNNEVTPFININEGFYNYYLVPSNDWIVLINKYCYETTIYKVSDRTNYVDVPNEYGCFDGGILYSKVNNKIFYFEGMEEEVEQLTSIDVKNGKVDSLLSLPYSYNQPLGNLEAFLSSNEEIIYFSVADTNYPPSVNDKDYVNYFSLSSKQVIQKRRLNEFGDPNADGYLLHRGRNGKAIVESFYRNSTADSYYRLYDFDNDSVCSAFIFYQGFTTPYYTGDGKYLVLPETVDSSLKEINTGKFFIYDLNTGILLKTEIYPYGGEIYSFDNLPNNIYYIINLAEPTRQIYSMNLE
jgi:hypothetical protein